MKKSLNLFFIAAFALLSLLAVESYSRKAHAQAPSQYPILDMIANKVIQKYQQSTCEDLWKQKSQKAPPKPEEQRNLDFLHNDAQMRAAFINKSGAPHRQ
jgi:hypothetical protein